MGHVLVIRGAPVSGKSTLLRERAQALRAHGREPITIDYDELAAAFGSTRSHGHAPQFTELAQRTRGLAIRLALKAAAEHNTDVIIVDSSPPASRMHAYEQAGAEIITLDVDPAELHARASRERPDEWHRLIDEWAPTQENAGWSWSRHPDRKQWPKRPEYRKATSSRRYQTLRAHFLADKVACAHCGIPFVTDAPCNHPRCLKRGKGCYRHPQYPTIQHLAHLVNGGPSLDVTTWEAWAQACNQADGARVGNRRRAQTPTHVSSVELDW